ncbi:MAG: translation initiation factor IF-2 [Chloroherpetonaceae bacterium]|nr:translation initiation factor IF-2 [Chloroherpetonaceae bacterium]MDW8438415.1 translation initiation factor IF-2 [Chloroherpetonaceae bacterium]
MSEEKKKIVDLAEELRVSAQEIIEFLRSKDIKVASPSSKVDASTCALVYEQYNAEKAESESLRKKKAQEEKKRKGIATVSAKALDSKPVAPKPKPATVAEVVAPKLSPVAEPASSVAASDAPKETRIETQPQPVVESVVETLAATPAPEPQPASVAESAPVAEIPTPELAPVEVAPSETPSAEVAPSAEAPSAETQPLEAAEPEDDDADDSLELAPATSPVEQETELQRQIRQEQADIAARYGASENRGGLKVLGEIEVVKKKRKRKKSFGQQAKDMNINIAQPATPDKAPQAKAQPAPPPKPSAPKSVVGATFSTDAPPPSQKPTPREERLAKHAEDKNAKKKKKFDIDERTLERNIRQTIMDMDDSSETSARSKFRKLRKREREERKEQEEQQRAAESKIIKLTEFTSTHEFADLIGVAPKDVIAKCFKMGKFITINQRLDRETLELLALEFDKEIQFISEHEITDAFEDDEDAPEELRTRPPVVTIMGHVDHGKTSLLDYIRQSNVVAGEAGGITQHIGAYEVTLENGQQITFLDTPGHEAFTAMRARGAEVTDIVILVVAADDSVMPQTIEAINHAKAANVPIVVAINKIDKPEANPDKIRSQLAEVGVTVEEWGGDVQCQEISAKKGIGVRELLDKVLAQAELMDLKANYHPDKLPKGVVIESELDKGKGIVATVLVQEGLLKVGAPFVCGISAGRVRAMLDERGRRLEVAYPSQPVRVLGFEALPEAGDIFAVTPSDKDARDIAQRRQLIRREQEFRHKSRVRLNDISKQAQEGGVKELRVIIKADVAGSIEALADGLMKIQTSEVKVEIIHKGVGQITESDVLLAAASDAIIIGFRARPNLNAKKLAEREQIDIRYYTVIYHALEEIKDALEGMLSPEFVEEVTALVEIREVFRISKVGNIAGCMVLEGTLRRDSKVRLLRDGIQIYDGELASLKRFKDDVKEVEAGYECGLSLQGYDDIKVGDMIEAYQMVETKRKLVAES